jgi:Flp pilus assembly protein TadG
MTGAYRSDRGSVTTEVVLIVPIAIALLCLIALVGRTTTTRQTIEGAARDAARAATLQRNATAARAAATDAATTALDQSGLRCASQSIELDLTQFEPGGQVTAQVTCDVNLSDLGPLAVPASRTFEARSTSVIDTYRATETTP